MTKQSGQNVKFPEGEENQSLILTAFHLGYAVRMLPARLCLFNMLANPEPDSGPVNDDVESFRALQHKIIRYIQLLDFHLNPPSKQHLQGVLDRLGVEVQHLISLRDQKQYSNLEQATNAHSAVYIICVDLRETVHVALSQADKRLIPDPHHHCRSGVKSSRTSGADADCQFIRLPAGPGSCQCLSID